jgi:hypothetical protein
MTISVIKINPFISINYPPAVKKLDNGLNEYLFKLNEDISTTKLIKINFSTLYGYIYLMIEIRFKIGDSWYTARALLDLGAERNFILQILITQLHLTLSGRDADKI